MLRPTSSDTVLTAATMRSVRCCSGRNCFIASLLIRPGSDDPWPWYLPASTPLASGDPSSKPRFSALAGRDQFPLDGSLIKLYSICNPMKADHPRKCASVFACAIHQAGASEMPT